MASTTANEHSPLLPTSTPSSPESVRPARPVRNVTFNPNVLTKTIESEPDSRRSRGSHPQYFGPPSPASPSAISTGGLGGGPPMLSALNNKLRRRNSGGGGQSNTVAGAGLPLVASAAGAHQPKIGPQRSTKNAQKLKLLPNPELEGEEQEEESGREVYSQITRIKDATARRDAARLGKADRDRLPRVTAYCTAEKYQMDGIMRFLKGRGKTRGANPIVFDECIYTPYSYNARQAERSRERAAAAHSSLAADQERMASDTEGASDHDRDDLIDLHGSSTHSDLGNGSSHRGDGSLTERDSRDESAIADDAPEFDIHVHMPEVFLFDYGVVVIWGMSAAHEQRFLKELAKFEVKRLLAADVETEKFNFYYTKEYQPRIYNDFITLRDKNNYMTKLAISHGLAQSVKTSLFEELIANTIDVCKDIPEHIAKTGAIDLPRKQINMQIGDLFILRINIHLNGSVLDTPELFWVEPHLEPVYQAVRSYLEMDQRVGLLTERLTVIADLLAVLKDQLTHHHGEQLEYIVIILIAAEIVVALINIIVDVWVGVD
ncbi:Sad1-interacting factor 2 [Echria macrotheca]|uniref:Sad1-interacting factor 2 n=1 Tax=Echria macrotheca TaxID=438768 RepID=A0AAJ0FCI5_9PEZI|nr:Sad1-interacting factor 2 [Echria macrotheca]